MAEFGGDFCLCFDYINYDQYLNLIKCPTINICWILAIYGIYVFVKCNCHFGFYCTLFIITISCCCCSYYHSFYSSCISYWQYFYWHSLHNIVSFFFPCIFTICSISRWSFLQPVFSISLLNCLYCIGLLCINIIFKCLFNVTSKPH